MFVILLLTLLLASHKTVPVEFFPLLLFPGSFSLLLHSTVLCAVWSWQGENNTNDGKASRGQREQNRKGLIEKEQMKEEYNEANEKGDNFLDCRKNVVKRFDVQQTSQLDTYICKSPSISFYELNNP